ncbi:hypothetical protein NQ315_011339 [Exocentrus adspersus]|uniref:DDE Tnp4 domain-containing protein n=1 Tax=Exocentrus adspersus TaxID=1586481 RepID=A0AAV8VKK9_9CUCU|nr:hypothetical protein NQ315_016284 [Exocentrus adspersus]KAJ8914351.1 hypothetical protein NQ315_011339 [Exocentrus adspersus]
MKNNDPQQFFKYTRMSVATFNKLLNMITPLVQRRRNLPDSICPDERLALTLHYFSQGTSMQTIAWTYQMGHSTVHYIIRETANAIWDVLSPTYLKAPSTEIEWLKIAADFYTQWNFPNCLGALDGKHIAIQAPAKSGSLYFNYKRTFSIVLLACCDVDYNFTLIDIGAYGSESDAGICRNSIFGNMLEEKLLNVPTSRRFSNVVTNSNVVQPFVIVANEAFPLKS